MIAEFRGTCWFLSNFSPAPVFFAGDLYPTVEHAFQAAKCVNAKGRQRIRDTPSPGQAKKLGRQVTLRADWEQIKVGVMAMLVLHKFAFNTDLREKLLATGESELVEGNTWGDTFWGAVDAGTWPDGESRFEGRNELGRILMLTRALLVGTQTEVLL